VQNYYETALSQPDFFKQFRCGETLITIYNCPLKKRFVGIWSKYNYIAYIIDGRKIWHTTYGSYDLHKGSCVFVRKGAGIVEQFFETPFCIMVFFIPDEFICSTIKTRSAPIVLPAKKRFYPVISIDPTEPLEAFFHSMFSYFANNIEPDPSLLELKFRELILTLADNTANAELLSYFCALMNEPQIVALRRVMEDNYCYNLKLKQYAELSNRSLSAFKRDFRKLFKITPGKWLLEKRLNHAMNLLSNTDKTVSEAAFVSGFENPSHFSRSFKERFGITPTAVKSLQSV
jgi:AraC family transcriptional regulator, exoenzyme S synthesis regulatory protein ExsA